MGEINLKDPRHLPYIKCELNYLILARNQNNSVGTPLHFYRVYPHQFHQRPDVSFSPTS